MLKNMKIAPKLISCFIIITIVASISGILGTIFLIRSDQNYSTALVNNGFSQGDIGSFNTYLNKGSAVVRDIIMLTDPNELKSAQAELDEINKKMEASLVDLKKTCQTDAELSLIAVIEKDLPQYNTLRDQVVELGLQNKNEEALALFRNQARPYLNEAMQAATELSELNVTMGNEVSESLSNQSTTTIFFITAIIVIAMAASVIFAIVIARSIARPIIQVKEAAAKLAQGSLDIQIQAESADEVGEMTRSFGEATEMLRSYINEIAFGLGEMSKGNFNIHTQVQFKGDFQQVGHAVDTITSSLSQTMGQINQAADQVSSGADQVSSGAQALSQGATEQASSVQELAATINEISGQVQETAGNARSASGRAQEVGTDMDRSNQQMRQMMDAMDQISSGSKEIGKIIKTIEDIAFQTNILALNAAVEAARAGAAGKGFAVVADEVRNLASKSAEASKNTASLIENSIRQVENGTRIANETAQSLSYAVSGVTEVVSLVEKISGATVEQASSISQVTMGVDQISSVVQTNSATAEESAAASEELSSQATMLKGLVGQFKLKEDSVTESALSNLSVPSDDAPAPVYQGGFDGGYDKY